MSVYTEKRSALRWPVLLRGLYLPGAIVVVAIVLGVAVNPLWFLAVLVTPLFGPFLIGISLLYRNWPTGVRITDDGIAIGAVGSARASERHPTVNHQAWALFEAPWSSVRRVQVVTDPRRIEHLTASSDLFTFTNRWGTPRGGRMRHCQLGVLSAPSMRAMIVVDLASDTGVVRPEIRPARFFGTWFHGSGFSRRIEGRAGSTWVVPTRRPELVLAAIPASLLDD